MKNSTIDEDDYDDDDDDDDDDDGDDDDKNGDGNFAAVRKSCGPIQLILLIPMGDGNG